MDNNKPWRGTRTPDLHTLTNNLLEFMSGLWNCWWLEKPLVVSADLVLVVVPLQISECSVEEDQRDEVVWTVWARTTWSEPPDAVRACRTSICFFCVCWVLPSDEDRFCETICVRGRGGEGKKWSQINKSTRVIEQVVKSDPRGDKTFLWGKIFTIYNLKCLDWSSWRPTRAPPSLLHNKNWP